jgi:hypothetical protein
MRVIDIQESQTWIEDYMDGVEDYASTMIQAGPAFSMLDIDNEKVLGIAGVWEQEKHRAIAWAIIDRQIRSDYIHYHKAVKKFLFKCKYQRVEMAVDIQVPQAKRWAEMLGFKLEGLMERYFANGSDAYLYARVK